MDNHDINMLEARFRELDGIAVDAHNACHDAIMAGEGEKQPCGTILAPAHLRRALTKARNEAEDARHELSGARWAMVR